MLLSISTSFLGAWKPLAMVECFARHGWHTLELHDIHAYRVLHSGPPDDAGTRFKKLAADHGISFPQCHFCVFIRETSGKSLGYLDNTPASDRALAETIDDMRRWLDFLNALDVRAGVLHIGGGGVKEQGWTDERLFARRVEVLSTIAEYAEGGPTAICLENLEIPFGEPTAEGMLRLISAVGRDNVGICLDTGHAHLAGLKVSEFILRAGDKLKALHVDDNAGHTDDHLLPCGKGTIDWGEVVPALRPVGYDGLFNFEVSGESKCPKPVQELKLGYALELAELMIGDA